MTWAKRAQVGFVNSRFIDPEPTSAHVASMVRGLSHCQSIGDGAHAAWVEEYVNPRLNALPNLYPGLVQGTRQRGYAFAFDLPTPELMSATSNNVFGEVRWSLLPAHEPFAIDFQTHMVHAKSTNSLKPFKKVSTGSVPTARGGSQLGRDGGCTAETAQRDIRDAACHR